MIYKPTEMCSVECPSCGCASSINAYSSFLYSDVYYYHECKNCGSITTQFNELEELLKYIEYKRKIKEAEKREEERKLKQAKALEMKRVREILKPINKNVERNKKIQSKKVDFSKYAD